MKKLLMVIGASHDSEVGFAICEALAAQGYRLILVGRRQTALKKTQDAIDGEHIVAPFDITQLDEIEAWMTALCRAHGKLDGLVISASYQGFSPLRNIKSDLIHRYFDTNVAAALMLVTAFSKKQHHQRPSVIVTIGSVAGLKGIKGRSLYAATKAALISITQSAALELAEKQIRVNCIAPALVAGEKVDKHFSVLNEAQQSIIKDTHPFGFIPPNRIAEMLCFLCSAKASHITGQTLVIDGGFSIT